MTNREFEQSEKLGQPVELYLFTLGTGPDSYIAYCNKDTAVVHGGITYEPEMVDRGDIVASGSTDKSALKLEVSANSEIAQAFVPYAPSVNIVLVIRSGHYNDPDNDFPVVWTGQVYAASRSNKSTDTGSGMTTLTCRPASVSQSRTGLRTHYQLGCNKVLYGPRCRADKALATVTAPTVSVSYAQIVLAENWFGPFTPSNFVAGTVEWDGVRGREHRTILSVTGENDTVLSLAGATTGLDVSEPVDVVLGCNRQYDGDCQSLHDNIKNFGGCPYIPEDDPLEDTPF